MRHKCKLCVAVEIPMYNTFPLHIALEAQYDKASFGYVQSWARVHFPHNLLRCSKLWMSSLCPGITCIICIYTDAWRLSVARTGPNNKHFVKFCTRNHLKATIKSIKHHTGLIIWGDIKIDNYLVKMYSSVSPYAPHDHPWWINNANNRKPLGDR